MAETLTTETVAAAHGVASDSAFGAVSPPLHLSTTFAFESCEQARAYDYGRAGNPNMTMLAEALARLEGGAGAVVACSGMAAIDLLVSTVSPAAASLPRMFVTAARFGC